MELLQCGSFECYFNHEGMCAIDLIAYVENEDPEILDSECDLLTVS